VGGNNRQGSHVSGKSRCVAMDEGTYVCMFWMETFTYTCSERKLSRIHVLNGNFHVCMFWTETFTYACSEREFSRMHVLNGNFHVCMFWTETFTYACSERTFSIFFLSLPSSIISLWVRNSRLRKRNVLL
jgi:membrane-bound inhibitor of C-type lysozyme